MSDVPLASGDYFRLFKLPPELRLMIYAHALPANAKFTRKDNNESTSSSGSQYPNLLLASKQVHNEAAPTFYKQNQFSKTTIVVTSDVVQTLRDLITSSARRTFAKKSFDITLRMDYHPTSGRICRMTTEVRRATDIEGTDIHRAEDNKTVLTSALDLDAAVTEMCVGVNKMVQDDIKELRAAKLRAAKAKDGQ